MFAFWLLFDAHVDIAQGTAIWEDQKSVPQQAVAGFVCGPGVVALEGFSECGPPLSVITGIDEGIYLGIAKLPCSFPLTVDKEDSTQHQIIL